ncbi:hypothetical protein [Streptantibioticus ferralitis]|uniref:Uncharacterized protein n=1 Tax=Streptantibioticus ferralitis TaxID=236510 RepID=A0ABT5ZAZ1_9ACTN|nr:hypothetical protein [Streptantibioticus ferralitis]MDF2261010.1 hypothetical protein [Streptantibioticus ferralitis]
MASCRRPLVLETEIDNQRKTIHVMGAALDSVREAADPNIHRVVACPSGDIRNLPLKHGKEEDVVLLALSPDTPTGRLHEFLVAATSMDRRIGFIATTGGRRAVRRRLDRLAGVTGREFLSGATATSQFGFSGTEPGAGEWLRIRAFDDPRSADEATRGYRLLGLATHSNGLDAPLGTGVLCPLADDRRRPTSHSVPVLDGRHPTCVAGGPCARAHRNGSVLVDPPLVHPRRLAAEVLVWQTCFGGPGDGWMFDVEYALIHQLLARDNVHNVLTPFRSVEADDSLLLYALALNRAGHRLGDVCLELNRATLRNGAGAPWMLYGDPDWRSPDDAGHEGPVDLRNTGRGGGPPARITLAPGDLRVLALPDGTACYLTAAPGAGRPVEQERLLLRGIRGSERGVLLYTGAESVEVTLRADDRAQAPAAVRMVESVWSRLAGLRSSLRMVELAREDGATDPGRAEALEAELSWELRYHAAALAASSKGAPLLNGTVSHLTGLAVDEAQRWTGLHRALLDFTTRYCRDRGPVLSFLYEREAVLLAQWDEEGRCPYCGSPQDSSEVFLPGSGHRRRRTTCSGCGPVADTSDGIRLLSLRGPATCRAGESTTYRLDGVFEQSPTGEVRQLAARLVFAHVPWNMGSGGPEAEICLLPGQHSMPSFELTVAVDRETPVGVYYLSAAVVCDGDLWTVNRPITVVAAAAGPPAAGSAVTHYSSGRQDDASTVLPESLEPA